MRRTVSIALLALVLASAARAADITVLSAGAFQPVLEAVRPRFEQASGDRLRIAAGTGGELARRVAAGTPFDVLVAPQGTVEALAAALQPGSALPLARVGIGVVVRRGAPIPDVGTADALRQTLLAAPSIGIIDPASGGSSGPAVLKLFEQLGIADAVRPRLVLKQGGAVAELVADGRAALGLHQISEILPVPGVVLAGPLPASLQSYTRYAGAIGRDAADTAAARALLATLRDPASADVLRSHGMEPLP